MDTTYRLISTATALTGILSLSAQQVGGSSISASTGSNKCITQIQYNHLNLPSRITYSNGRVINYVYSASGTKLKVTHKPSGIGITTKTDYVNGYIFTNNSLSMAQTGNGYFTLSSTGDPIYHFYLKDHQGNNRMVVSQSGSVEQINHYYPYGALFAESTNGDVQRFKYNGYSLGRDQREQGA